MGSRKPAGEPPEWVNDTWTMWLILCICLQTKAAKAREDIDQRLSPPLHMNRIEYPPIITRQFGVQKQYLVDRFALARC